VRVLGEHGIRAWVAGEVADGTGSVSLTGSYAGS
jgi:hypothetical protein